MWRYERIRGDVAASSVTLCSCSRVSARVGLRESSVKGEREGRGEREREEGRSGWPGKTGRTGFLGRVGESLYSVSLFLRSELAGLSSEHLRSLHPRIPRLPIFENIPRGNVTAMFTTDVNKSWCKVKWKHVSEGGLFFQRYRSLKIITRSWLYVIVILLFVRRERGNVSSLFFTSFLRNFLSLLLLSLLSPFFLDQDVCTYDVYRSILDIISLYLTFPPRSRGGPIFFGRLAKITVYKRVRVGEERKDIFLFWRTLASRLRRYVGQRAYIFLRGPIHRERERCILDGWQVVSVCIAKVRRYLSPIFLFFASFVPFAT